MRQRFAIVCVALCLLLFITPKLTLADDVETEPVYRALLIACDEYITYPDTTPTAHNNLLAIESLLSNDTRGFVISVQDGITQSLEALSAAIDYAFRDATANDVSYLYISSHGAFSADAEDPEGELILSDGIEEARIGARDLSTMLNKVPGTKLLIVDACNSGALINKGISPDDNPEMMSSYFSSDSYKALVSSGGSEPSWYWKSDVAGPPLGSSYFTMALVEGSSDVGEYAADRNRDGSITLDELYQYLRVSYAAATAQVMPAEDDFIVFKYDTAQEQTNNSQLTGFVFDRTTLDALSPQIHFSFTVSRQTRIGYQLVFMQNGVWNWQDAEVWLDSDDSPGNRTGYVSPGRKQRTLSLTNVSERDWGYALLNIIRYEGDQPIVVASRVISVQPLVGDPGLDVSPMIGSNAIDDADIFDPSVMPLPIWVGHAYPCSLTVTIKRSSNNRTIRWLSVNQPTRPQGITPNGSLFYWDGKDQDGALVEDGEYIITCSTRIGHIGYSASYKISVLNTDK